MQARVQIQVPNTGRTLEGVLVRIDKPQLRLTVRLDEGAETLRPNMLAQAVLTVGGAPRVLTVQVNPLDETTVSLLPVSGVQCCERRARKRYAVNLPTTLQVEGESIPVRVVNISISGVGLHTPRPLEVGQQACLELRLVGCEQPMQATLSVRHCRALANHQWYVGAAFTNLNRADELWLRKLFP
ncbi:MAG: PilZ domain-containing protein [Fimbriimonadales bacterium]|nr:PilZ domain-containing protein [Fimbriimonadales bacterium]